MPRFTPPLTDWQNVSRELGAVHTEAAQQLRRRTPHE
jgi:hypothetical protein